MTEPQQEPLAQTKLHWYRVPIDRALLAKLNQRSDGWGFAQTLGHLGIIIATGALSWYAALNWGWYVLALCLSLRVVLLAWLPRNLGWLPCQQERLVAGRGTERGSEQTRLVS